MMSTLVAQPEPGDGARASALDVISRHRSLHLRMRPGLLPPPSHAIVSQSPTAIVIDRGIETLGESCGPAEAVSAPLSIPAPRADNAIGAKGLIASASEQSCAPRSSTAQTSIKSRWRECSAPRTFGCDIVAGGRHRPGRLEPRHQIFILRGAPRCARREKSQNQAALDRRREPQCAEEVAATQARPPGYHCLKREESEGEADRRHHCARRRASAITAHKG